ncbi:MAG TPA: hypothetical protein VKU36_00240 [Candidatus Babeliales bacterium]|nr:hypothetical protein [Candidatus Babeliales bacterium]
MNYSFYLAVLILTLPNTLLYNMEQTLTEPENVTKYPLKGDIRQVYWINKERAILRNESSWTLINPATGMIIRSQELKGMEHIALHPHEPLFAASHHKTVSIHDIYMGNTKTKLTINRNPVIMESVFNADDLLFVLHEQSNLLTVYDYINDNHNSLHFNKNIISIASHPSKNEIALFTEKELFLVNTENSHIEKTIAMATIPPHVYPQCKYNLDGSLITLQHGEKIHLVDPANNKHSIIPIPFKDYFQDCMFYPNNNTLVTISQVHGTLHFWDVKTLKLLETIESNIKKNSFGMLFFDEKDLIISFKNRILRIPVPFTIFQHVNNT